jgi:archaellum component FlaG (FlaF/FlaG flagellin family)
MPKKRIDLPPIDFTSVDNEKWVGKQFSNHPEIISGGLYKKSNEDLKRTQTGELDIISRPGKPKSMNNKIDWDAWFLYYNLCILSGFQETYESISVLVDRSPITVKQKFIEIGNQLTKN